MRKKLIWFDKTQEYKNNEIIAKENMFRIGINERIDHLRLNIKNLKSRLDNQNKLIHYFNDNLTNQINDLKNKKPKNRLLKLILIIGILRV